MRKQKELAAKEREEQERKEQEETERNRVLDDVVDVEARRKRPTATRSSSDSTGS